MLHRSHRLACGRAPRASASVLAVLAAAITLGWVAPPAQPPTPPPPTPLADRVPAGAVFYAAWYGRSSLPPEFADSHLSLILEALDLPAWSRDTLPGLLPPNARNNPVVDQILDLGRAIVTYAWTYPSAVYSVGPGVTDNLTPGLQLCFLIQFPDTRTADEAERDIQDRISALTQGNPIPNLRFWRQGTVLALSANDTTERSPLDPIKSPLSAEPRYQLAVRQTLGDPAGVSPGARPITLYFDLEKLWALADDREENRDNPEYERNMRLAGLKQAKALMVSAGIDGTDFVSNAFVELAKGESNSPRTGILGFLTSPKPVDDRLYGGIPRTAVSMTSISLDLADLLARIKVEGEAFKAGFTETFDAWVGLIGGMLNVNLAEFTANFGAEAALYSLPGAAPATWDFVVVTRPKDAGKADEQLFGLAQGVQRLVLTQRPDLPRVVLDRAQDKGLTVTTASQGTLTPSWAVKDGYLLIAPSRQGVSRAIAEMEKGVLTDADAFTALRSRLKAPAGASLGYADLPRSLMTQFGNWQSTARFAGSRLPRPLRQVPLPSAEILEPHTSPSASAAWVDDAGFHYRTLSPYPAGELLSATFSLLAGPNSLPVKLPQLAAQLRRGPSDAPQTSPGEAPRTSPNRRTPPAREP